MEDGYKELAAAVIKLAVRDYEMAYKRLLRHPDSQSAQDACRREKKFFYSQWFEVLAENLEGQEGGDAKMKFIPHKYQEYAISFIEQHKLSILLLDMGLGLKILAKR